MVSKAQINSYNSFINNLYDNIYDQVFHENKLNIKKIQNIISNKENLINSKKYNDFIEIAYKSNFLSYNKDILKNYIDSYLEKYITTITKNIIVRFFYEMVEKNEARYSDFIEIHLFLNIFFRYKGNNDIFNNIKDIVLSWWTIKNMFIEKTKETLNDYYKKTNYQSNSIFKNQLIKFLKQKQIKENKWDVKFASTNYEENLMSFQSIQSKWHWYETISTWGNDYDELKDRIISILIDKYSRKRNIDYKTLNYDIISVAYELWNESNINTQTNFFTNFIQEFKENIVKKINKVVI